MRKLVFHVVVPPVVRMNVPAPVLLTEVGVRLIWPCAMRSCDAAPKLIPDDMVTDLVRAPLRCTTALLLKLTLPAIVMFDPVAATVVGLLNATGLLNVSAPEPVVCNDTVLATPFENNIGPVPLKVYATDELTVMVLRVNPPPLVGAYRWLVTLGKVRSEVMLGTVAGFQLPEVDIAALFVPVHVHA